MHRALSCTYILSELGSEASPVYIMTTPKLPVALEVFSSISSLRLIFQLPTI